MSKIKTIHVKNLKAVTEVTANFNGCSALVIAGNNKGKSTLLKSLQERLQSIKPELILRSGEKDGISEIELTTGEKFVWEFDIKGRDRLSFITKEGLGMSLTKEIINKYFAPQFDIDKFLASTPKERSKMLQKLAGIDFTAIDTEYKIAYEQRTYANRVLKDAHAKQVPIFHTLEEEKIIDITQLQEDIALTMKNNMDIANAQDRCDKIKSEIVELEKKITTLQEEANYHYNTILKLPIVDISKKEQAFKDAMAHNEKALELRKQREANAAYISAETQALIAEEAVKIIEQKKKDMLKASNLPDGIAIEEDGVTVDGFALDKSQISTSKLYITALKLAALNLADVKCLTFDASPLDKNSLEDIQEWAFKNDLQLLIEKPDFDGGEIQYQLIEEVAHAE